MRIAIIDDYSFRSRDLSRALGVPLYVRRWNHFVEVPEAIRLWNLYIFPFQVVYRMIVDRMHIVHIENDSRTFGGILSTMMVVPMLIMLRLARKKIVIDIHFVITRKELDIQTITILLAKVYYKLVGVLANIIITDSKVFTDRLATLGVESVTIPLGIYEVPKVLVEKDNYFTILCHGHITKRKDIRMVKRAVSIMRSRNIRLIVSGGGNISMEQMYRLFRLADIVVLPYKISVTSDILSFAAGCSKAVVATRTEYFEEIINDDNGWIVDNEYQMASAFDNLIENPALRLYLGTNLGKLKETRNWDEVARITWKVYNSLCA